MKKTMKTLRSVVCRNCRQTPTLTRAEEAHPFPYVVRCEGCGEDARSATDWGAVGRWNALQKLLSTTTAPLCVRCGGAPKIERENSTNRFRIVCPCETVVPADFNLVEDALWHWSSRNGAGRLTDEDMALLGEALEEDL